MARETSYTEARANLASFCDEVAAGREPLIIHRRGAKDVALVAADELEALAETAHLLRSPKNAKRLMTALRRARAGGDRAGGDRGGRLGPQSIDKLRREFGLGKEV
ncbi:MAG TPA: type II toxin-antitoxin system prevent-host-death family antitoxin [Candidatus Binataceae bacterium]|nr:type II toxin-antitoxin system prevent-host-death family antitoxin [Candidatus Binataceae bacterium]